MMKPSMALATLLLLANVGGAQDRATGTKSATKQAAVPVAHVNVADPSGDVSMKGDAQIDSEIGMSFGDHRISGVKWKVSDDSIDLWGTVPDKHQKHLARAIADAYADGRTVHDHVKDGSKAR